MRNKIPKEEKKKSTSVKINSDVVDLFDKYVEEQGIKNKSKFIEDIIISELKNKIYRETYIRIRKIFRTC